MNLFSLSLLNVFPGTISRQSGCYYLCSRCPESGTQRSLNVCLKVALLLLWRSKKLPARPPHQIEADTHSVCAVSVLKVQDGAMVKSDVVGVTLNVPKLQH